MALSIRVQLLCYLVVACLGVALIGLGAASIGELQRYTPIYKDVVCKPAATSIVSVSMSGSLKVVLHVDVICANPNPYELVVSASEMGKCLLGEGNGVRDELGTVLARGAILPATKHKEDAIAEGTIVLVVTIEAGFFKTISLISDVLQGPVDVYFELRMDVLIEPQMLGMHAATIKQPVSEQCGLQIQLLPDQITGDAVCEETFDSLLIPPITEASDISMGFTAQVEPQVIKDAEAKRDLILGLVISICFIGGVLFLTVPLCYFAWIRQRDKRVFSPSPVHAETIGNPSS